MIRFHQDRTARGERICGCPFLHLGSELVREDPRIQRIAQAILREYFDLFRDLLRDARRSGDLETEDPDALARIHDDPQVLEDLIPGARRLLGLSPPPRNA